MSFYWHFNASTGKLVYSNSSTYGGGSGGSWLALEQTNINPTDYSDWAFNSYRSSIASVEWDESNGKVGGLTSMYYMFYNCTSLTALDLSGLDTSLVTDMSYMFQNCKSLTSLDLSGFDTSQVTEMSYIFRYCSGLTSLDVSGFNTSLVTGMAAMFEDCSGLISLDLSGFNTSRVTGMGGMFENCSSLTSLDLSGFDTSRATSRAFMFTDCSSLRLLAISGSMSNVLTQLPASQYYPASGGDPVAKANLTAGTWIRDLGDRDLLTSLAQQSAAFKALSDRLGRLEEKVLGSSQAPSYGDSAPDGKLTSIIAQAQAVMSLRRRITALAKQVVKTQ